MTRRPRRVQGGGSQRGFTLVELMIAVGLSGLVIGLVFQIHLRLVDAFDGQASVSEVVDRAAAARSVVVREVRMAGIAMPAAGLVSPDGDTWHAVEVDNDVDGTGADQLVIRRGIGTAHTVANAAGTFTVSGAATEGFAAGEPMIVTTYAIDAGCVAIPSVVNDTYITINWTANPGCAGVSAASTLIVSRLSQVAYRLDPAALDDGILERSATAGVSDDWEPYGLGFSNIQLAIRMSEPDDTTDADGDGNPALDWYSGDNMEPGSVDRPADGIPVQLGISVEARNLDTNSGAVSTATLPLTDLDRPDNNPLGDWGSACPGGDLNPCGVDLLDVASSRPPRYSGDHVYRTTSTRVWLRNQAATL